MLQTLRVNSVYPQKALAFYKMCRSSLYKKDEPFMKRLILQKACNMYNMYMVYTYKIYIVTKMKVLN